jgi:hypothetical protein
MMGIQMRGGGPFIFPIWHDIESEDVAKQSPILASIVAARTRVMDVEQIAEAVAQSVPGFDAEVAKQTVVNTEVSKFTDEERTMLQGLLNLNRRIFKYWYDVAHNYWHDSASAWEETINPDDALQNAREARDYHELVNARGEIDGFASDEMLELTETLAEHIRNCQQRLIYEVNRNGVSDPKRQGPLWREVQVGVRDAFVSQGTEAAYLDLRERVRDELKR